MTLSITLGAENTISADNDVHPFRFSDGTLCVWATGTDTYWSTNGGNTWSTSPPGGRTNPGPIGNNLGEQDAFYCDGDGTIISISATCTGTAPGPYALNYRKSTNDWRTVSSESAVVTAPNAKPYIGDAGDTSPSYLFHHGHEFLPSGLLMCAFFGANVGDDTLYDAYPASFGAKKGRMMMLYSDVPYGSAWGNAVTVAYDNCLVRGTQGDPLESNVAYAYPITQEGFNETDVKRLRNGTYFAVTRTGGRKAVSTAPTQFTPLYGTMSTDGLNWNLPRALMLSTSAPIVSSSPNIAVLGNGVVCLVYALPEAYIAFWDPSASPTPVWTNVTQLTTSGNDLDLVQIRWNTVLVLYYSPSASAFVARQIVVDIVGQTSNAYIQMDATPIAVRTGRSALLQWFSQNTTSITLTGGPYSGLSVGTDDYKTTGLLTTDTTFTLNGISTVDASAVSASVTVRVV